MSKKHFFLAVSFFLISALLWPVKARAGARLILDPASGSYSVNEEFSVKVKVDPANNDIVAIDSIINFDSDKLEVISVAEETYFKSSTVGTAQGFTYNIENDNGKLLIYSFANIGNFSLDTPGTIATIKFKAAAAGTASVTFSCQADSNSDSSLWSAEGEDLIDCAAVGSGSYTIGSGGSDDGGESGSSGSTSSSTATPTALPETGVVEPMIFALIFGGLLFVVGYFGLIV